MKILSFSNICLIAALILGAFIAWSATMPQQISGERIGGCPCYTTKEEWCGTREDAG